MTNEEKQEIINAVLSAIMTNSKTIEQLTPTESLSDNDAIEVSGGRRISYAAFLSAVQEGVQLMLDGYLTGEAAVAWFAALENNPANYVGASADPVQLHWRQSPIVLLDSMGEDLDGDDDFTAQVGDKWWDPSNDNSRNYIFLKTSTGQAGWPIGSGNVNGVLYVNKRTGRMYLWDGTDMVELVGAGENDDNEGIGIVNIDDVDFAVGDAQGNIIVEFDEGHIKTSEFDSAQVSQQVAANTESVENINQQIAGIGGQSDVAVKNEDDAPFDISDASGNVVLRVNGQGHIQTKGYDSQFAAMTLETPMCICHAVSSPLGDAYNHTMKHFRTAIARGHQFIECDGYNCMDGVPVCAHNSSYSFYVKNSTTGETASKSFPSINSADLIAGYTWTAPTIENGVITEYGEPIIKVTDLVYFVCYIHRCNLYIDAKGMNTQSVKDVLDYAESIGCRQLVWIEPSNNNISLSGVQCNICAAGVTLENMSSKVAANKRDGYNLMLQLVKANATSKMRRDFAEAAHSYGCYAYTWSMNSAQETRGWFDDGFDFIFTEGYTTVTWYITKYTVFNLQ